MERESIWKEMNALTKQEIENDLREMSVDLERLRNITVNLRAFINDSFGEDRSRYKVDLLKWESIYNDGLRLKRVIADKLLQIDSQQ